MPQQRDRRPNDMLIRARLHTPSPGDASRCMSRQELAETASAFLDVPIDSKYIGKLERGLYRWPNRHHREAIRRVLGVAGDHDLGFYTTRSRPTTSLPNSPASSAGWATPDADTPPCPGSDVPVRVAICGSRKPGTDSAVIDEAVIGLSSLLVDGHVHVNHGPVGVGIEVMTYIANHYRPAHLRQAIGIFGHPNVVKNITHMIIVGGGQGTHDEVDLALGSPTRIIPIRATGGAAQRAHQLMADDPLMRQWIHPADFESLGTCRDADTIADVVGRLIAHDQQKEEHSV